MKINPAVFWLLLSTACCLGFMMAGLFRGGLITRLFNEIDDLRRQRRDLAEQLAKATGHPSRRLRVVGGDGARLR